MQSSYTVCSCLLCRGNTKTFNVLQQSAARSYSSLYNFFILFINELRNVNSLWGVILCQHGRMAQYDCEALKWSSYTRCSHFVIYSGHFSESCFKSTSWLIGLVSGDDSLFRPWCCYDILVLIAFLKFSPKLFVLYFDRGSSLRNTCIFIRVSYQFAQTHGEQHGHF